ncbi:retropepsin-like aspartic protease [Xanthomonas fragariae]|uniref:retropepsin-like aspartic protease n=1 Tax=Xanthomonas fragariae TaxID=48664 RepID=UPI0022AAFF9E|nr:retropepsin-like aspartic protease [Xanthomonas fragariae]WAT15044.1 retropepsin-like aspartic protease [Xanthomonas fragariae]
MLTRFLIFSWLTLTCFQTYAENILPQDGPGITLMVLRGEVSPLEKLSNSDGLAKLPAKAGLFRVESNFDASNKAVEECLKDRKVLAQKGAGALYLCKSLQAGNSLALGDIAGWARTMLDVRKIYLENIKPSFKAGDDAEAITWPHFEAFLVRRQSGILKPTTTTSVTLPLVNAGGVPVVKATIHGGLDGKRRDVISDFVVDTGSTRSILNERFARSLGLKITNNFNRDAIGASREVLFNLADPVDLKMGELTLQDVSFSTSNDVPINIIGMDLLRQFGAVEMSKESFKILGRDSRQVCNDNFRLTSLIWGSPMTPRIPAIIRGREELVLLDTGSSTSLEASGIDLTGFPQKDLRTKRIVDLLGERTISYAESTVTMVLNSRTFNINASVTDQKGMVFPVSWRMGYDLISKSKLYLDAMHGRACLIEG